MKFILIVSSIFLIFSISLGAKCSTDPPPESCLDNALTVAETLKDTYPIVIVEGDYYPDSRHVDCFYWEDGRWKRGHWTGSKIMEIPQDTNFSANVYSYEEYLKRVDNFGWR